jgi:hypothetical protein
MRLYMRVVAAALSFFCLSEMAAAQNLLDGWTERLEAGECPRVGEGGAEDDTTWSPCPVGIAPWQEVRDLIADEQQLDLVCRGRADAEEECNERNLLGRRITEMGWCYGRDNDYGYMTVWHGCEADSSGRDGYRPFRMHFAAVAMTEVYNWSTIPSRRHSQYC